MAAAVPLRTPPCEPMKNAAARSADSCVPQLARARHRRIRRALPVLFAVFALAAGRLLAQAQPPPVECRDWQTCRMLALEARERGEHESFHDLAWRAVQTGPPRQPALMLLLARAQSLSGRPDDALVMLRRIVELGVAPAEALSDPDFRRARAMARWPEVEAAIVKALASQGGDARPAERPPTSDAEGVETRAPAAAGAASPAAPSHPRATSPAETAPAEAARATGLGLRAGAAAAEGAPPEARPGDARGRAAGRERPTTPVVPGGPGGAAPESTPAPAGTAAPAGEAAGWPGGRGGVSPPPAAVGVARLEEARRFPAPGIVPGGFAYDAVSGRFLLGSRRARKIVVVGDESTRLVDLVRAESAGFEAVLALEIDTRRGDLWVASAVDGEVGGPGRAALHKLQLVSGRPLLSVPLPAEGGSARPTALAVTPGGAVLAFDAEGRRLWRVAPGTREAAIAARLDVEDVAGIAAASDRVAYVGHAGGLLRVELPAGPAAPVTEPPGLSLSGLESVRWHAGAIVAVQRAPDDTGGRRLVRLHLDRTGARVTDLDLIAVVDPALAAPAGTAIAGDTFYYLAPRTPDRGGNGTGAAIGDAVVWKVALR